MKTIIGFDSWTEGSQYFERLIPALEVLGYRLILIHIGSWGHDLFRPIEEKIGRLEVRDISYYGGMTFKKILENEQPVAVIFFSTRALAHQAFNRYCGFFGIPTIHIYHGLVTVQDVGADNASAWNINWRNQLSLIRNRLYKNLTIIWPVFWRSLVETRATISDFLDFFREIAAKVQLKNVPAPKSASTTAGCVYSISDVAHMARIYQIPEPNIYVVGNPDLAGFGLQEINLGSWLRGVGNKSCSEIVYVDTALIECGLVFSDQDEFINHLVETSVALKEQGFRLVVKLHPAHYRTGVPERLIGLNIALCGKEDFASRLQNARAALVEPSTAAVIPGLLGMPMLLAAYGKLAGQRYGSVLTSYPMSAPLCNLAEVGSLLEVLRKNANSDDVMAWIKKNSGPLPAEDMPRRVADVIVGICSSSETTRRNG